MAHVIPGAEKRRWQRLPVSFPMFIRGVDEQGKGFLEYCTALNISAGGALLVTRRYLPRSSKISLQIQPPPIPKQVFSQFSLPSLKARVVQVRNSDRYFLCGLAFSRPMAVN